MIKGEEEGQREEGRVGGRGGGPMLPTPSPIGDLGGFMSVSENLNAAKTNQTGEQEIDRPKIPKTRKSSRTIIV